MLPVLVALFVLSGAAGLMYESIWTRYLGLFVGHSAYAQLLVLVIFLGGMSLGAHLVGRRSARVREPLVWYAAVELAVGAIAVVFHPLFVAVTNGAYDALFPALGGGAVVTAAKWTIAALLILPQSVLLGATFPLMSAGALRRTPGAPGRTLALLYFANSLGAAGGVLVAGFVLLGRVGLPGTLAAAAACNLLVAVGAYGAARADEGEVVTAVPAADVGAPPDARPRRVPRVVVRTLLGVAFGTAASSFVYEIAWIRMLSLVVGSATHSFELMLSAFILGLALGAWWVRGRADRFADPMAALGLTQWVMGSLAIATLPVYLWSFHAMAWLLAALDLTPEGYTAFSLARYALCLVVMLPATFCAGITLPLITRVLLARGVGEGAIGRVYAVNTLGSIVGAAVAGLVLLPVLGLKWLLVAGALIDVGLGVWLLMRLPLFGEEVDEGGRATPPRPTPEGADARPRRPRLAGAETAARAYLPVGAAATVILVLLAASTPFDPAVLTSGVYRYAQVSDPKDFVVPFYADGRTATVSVRRHNESRMLSLATNGKPDASLSLDWIRPAAGDTTRHPIEGDQVTQVLLPLITLAHAPNARTGVVIGEGSGMTSHLLLGSPALRALRTVDIEPMMVRGSRQFYPANRRVFDDPRSAFVLDDAKAYFAGAGRRFDLILSEPSNPWVSGVSGLFTDEFYARVTRYLVPGGVFGQWLHLYEIDDPLVTSVLAALHRHFPAYAVYLVSPADILVVATTAPALREPDWRVVNAPAYAADLRHALPLDSATLAAALLADREALAPLLAGYAPVNSDYHPVLDLGAERTRYQRRSAAGYRGLPLGRFDPVAGMRGWRVGFTTRPVSPVAMPRHLALARGAALRGAWDAREAMARAAGGGGEAPMLGIAREDEGWVRDAVYRRAAYEVVLATRRAPADWRRFVAQALECEGDVHGGTAGVADSAFYARTFAYLEAADAPEQALQALHFVHGLAAYRWDEANAAAKSLRDDAAQGDRWVDAELLLDGSVVAALRTGDVAGARQALAQLRPLVRRRAEDVRDALLDAWVPAGTAGRAPVGRTAPGAVAAR
ncbi:hypothetical protein tb265_22700 [Gemmatimonadetes bacterium T265]|nr:hypothetical protein tb265_22700 [Gemmatimonadetes bacterium T265]